MSAKRFMPVMQITSLRSFIYLYPGQGQTWYPGIPGGRRGYFLGGEHVHTHTTSLAEY